MSGQRSSALIDELRSASSEKDWVEFKSNYAEPEMVGRLVSAMSNAARLADKPFAYIVWGIRDGDHAVVGTTFNPGSEKHQQQPLEFWLAQRLKPSIAFSFREVEHPNRPQQSFNFNRTDRSRTTEYSAYFRCRNPPILQGPPAPKVPPVWSRPRAQSF
ncbi:MAG: putative DNA binding domain-containing protein [Bryobacterales bacterium]|nr:putative DNA binding domain-containing protein [Bryobacterales bacterium]